MSKSNRTSIFTPEFANAVKDVLESKCKNGDAVARKMVAKKLSGFGITDKASLTSLVGLALQEATSKGTAAAQSLADFEAIRGRFGGIYKVSQRDAWNKEHSE